jgi:hypothetical protein
MATATKEPKAAKAELSTEIKSFRVKARLLTPMLGTAPEDPNLYTAYLIEKALKQEYQAAKTSGDTTRVDALKSAMVAQELTTLPGAKGQGMLVDSPDEVKDALDKGGDGDDTIKGKTVFRRTQNGKGGPMLVGYMIRGFYKEAFDSHTDIPMPASKVDKFLWIGEFEVPIYRDGKPLDAIDAEWSRPLRTKDQRTGVNRTCLATSEVVNPVGDTTIEFTVFVMAKAFSQTYTGGRFKNDDVERVTQLALTFGGLGQFRNGGHGAFEVLEFEEKTVDWKDALKARQEMLKAGQQIYAGTRGIGCVDCEEEAEGAGA